MKKTIHCTKTERVGATFFLPLAAFLYFFAKLSGDKEGVNRAKDVWHTATKGETTFELN